MHFDQNQLYDIARHQKNLLRSLLVLLRSAFIVNFVIAFLSEALPAHHKAMAQEIGMALLALTLVPLLLWQTFANIRLAFAVRIGVIAVVVSFLGLLLPLLSMLMVLLVSNRATKALRAAGYKVGFLGTDVASVQADLEGVREEHVERFR